MHTPRFLALLLSGSVLAHAAPAVAEIQYDYLDIGLTSQSVGPADGEGLRVAGSLSLDETFYLVGGLSRVSLDPGNTDLDTLSVGLGARTALDDSLDLIGELSFEDLEVGGASDDGFALKAGLRKQLTPDLELDGYFKHLEVGGGDTRLGVAGVWRVSERASLTLGFEAGDVDELAIGLRLGF